MKCVRCGVTHYINNDPDDPTQEWDIILKTGQIEHVIFMSGTQCGQHVMQGGHSVGLCYKCMLSDAQRDNIKRV
jgi:hypothetical protein